MGSSKKKEQDLKERIAEWLALTQGMELPLGLEIDEALERASQLLPFILERKISPRDIKLDEEFKDVLYGLVALVEGEEGSGPGLTREARAVHRFIRQIPWPNDTYGEKEKLLNRCAAVGWPEAVCPDTPKTESSSASQPLPSGPEGSSQLADEEAEWVAAKALSKEEAREVLEDAVGRIREIFVDSGQLTRREARGLERDLYGWLLRFLERSPIHPRDLKGFLAATYLRLARDYQDGGESGGDRAGRLSDREATDPKPSDPEC